MAQADHNMQREIYSLEQLNAQLTTNESILHESMREADRIVEHVGRREVPPVDDVLVASSVVGEQLYKLVADDRSITDAMFVLTRALDKGRIRGDVFVKVCLDLDVIPHLLFAEISFLANKKPCARAVPTEGVDQEDW